MQEKCCEPSYHDSRPCGTADTMAPVSQVVAQSSCRRD